jgi:predicted AlkP superfamily phosphohydrolase/phosphomutase
LRVLAVGIDAGDPTLVRDLIDRGEMPTLRALLDRGRWALVDSGGDIGEAAMWPTFFTGSDPSVHQMYSRWCWQPAKMGCVPPDEASLTPFWRSLERRGATVGVVDVPGAPVGTGTDGFEVSEFGPHEVRHGETRVRGAAAESVLAEVPRHPFHDLPYGRGYTDDREGKARLAAACVRGARVRGELAARLISETRPDMAIVAFTEVHHGAHHLWHTTGASHTLYPDIADPRPPEPDLLDLYREVDRQIGRIVEAAGEGTAVLAFSLNGMRAGCGIPTLLDGLLRAQGFGVPSSWRGLSWRRRAVAAFGGLKRRVPAGATTAYQRHVGQVTRYRIAQPTIVPPFDWSRTRAFALPLTDTRGFIRVNLAGREAAGCVPEREYEATCEELESGLRAATNAEGEPIVEDVLRTDSETGAPPRGLPDLIVRWTDAAAARPVRVMVGDAEFESHPTCTDMTGLRTRHGFCIVDERISDGSLDEVVPGRDLHRLLLAPLGFDSGKPTTTRTG